MVLSVYLAVLTARAILSFVPLFVRGWQPRGIMLVLAEFVYTLTDPPLKLMRRLIPPVRLGGIALDLGFLVLYLGVSFLRNLVGAVFV
ncbi:MAG: YggT family protein [Micropruina sp.]|nr:YggT family protein [Micropruina sp.]